MGSVERGDDRFGAARPLLVGAAMAGAGALLPIALAWGFTHPPRSRHLQTPRSLGLRYERVRLRTEDGLRLSAWHVPASGQARGVAVICHGYFGNRARMLPHLQILHDAGFAALLFDFRAHGWSGGHLVTLGCAEQLDARAALDWVEAQEALLDLPIVLLGESMGASVALLAASEDRRVRAVIADSAFARLDYAVAGRMRSVFGHLGTWLAPSAQRAGERFLGMRCVDISPMQAIARLDARCPVLLIHGAEDRFIVPDNSRQLLEAARPGMATLWEAPGARHCRAIYVAPEEYARRILEFLDRLPLAFGQPVQTDEDAAGEQERQGQ